MKLNKEALLKVLQSFKDNTKDFGNLLNMSELIKDLTKDNVGEKALLIHEQIIREIESLNKIIENRKHSQKNMQNYIDKLDQENILLREKYDENSAKIIDLKKDIQEKTKKIQANIDDSTSLIDQFKENRKKQLEEENLKKKQLEKEELEIKNFEEELLAIKWPGKDESLKKIIEQNKENDLNQINAHIPTIEQKIKSLDNEIQTATKQQNSVKVFLPVWKFFNFFEVLNSYIQAREKIITDFSQEVINLTSRKDKCTNLETALNTLSSKGATLVESVENEESYENIVQQINLFNKESMRLKQLESELDAKKNQLKSNIADLNQQVSLNSADYKNGLTDLENKSLDLEIKKMEQEIQKLEDSNTKINKKLVSNETTKNNNQTFSLNRNEDIKVSKEKISKLEDFKKEIDKFLPKIKPSSVVGGTASFFKPLTKQVSKALEANPNSPKI